MNGHQLKLCAGCGGEHIASEKQSLPMAADPGRVYYCAACFPEAAGLEYLRTNAIAAAHKGAVAERWAEIVTTLGALAGGNAADRERYRAIAARILDEIGVAGVEAGKRGW